jgi:hypothetical protein
MYVQREKGKRIYRVCQTVFSSYYKAENKIALVIRLTFLCDQQNLEVSFLKAAIMKQLIQVFSKR